MAKDGPSVVILKQKFKPASLMRLSRTNAVNR